MLLLKTPLPLIRRSKNASFFQDQGKKNPAFLPDFFFSGSSVNFPDVHNIQLRRFGIHVPVDLRRGKHIQQFTLE